MSDIVLSQPGAVGTLTADGDIRAGVRCYLSAGPGFTAVSWTLTSVPSGSASTAKLHPTRGWYFDPDVTSQTPYVVRMTDSLSGTHSNSFTARAVSIKADGRQATDGILAAGSNVLQSASLNFTKDDIGRLALVRTPVSECPGTVSLTTGNVLIVGSGTAFLTNIPNIAGVPINGGAIYVDGEFFSLVGVVDDTTLHVRTAPTHNASGKKLYRDCQISTTVAAFIDSTHVRLNIAESAILVSGSSVLVTIGSDDTSAVHGLITSGFATTVDEVTLPPGLICMSQNLYFSSQTSLVIRGTSRRATVLLDCRKASDETLLSDRTRDDYGLLSFQTCTAVGIEDLSIDGSVPVLGMAHTTGGVANNSGGRIGIFFRDCDDCSIVRCGSQRYGPRDELFYADSISGTGTKNWRVENCVVEMSNNNSINAGNVGTGLLVRGNQCTSAYSCLQITARSAIMSDNILTGSGGFTEGNGADPVLIEAITNSVMRFCNNIIHNGDSHAFSNALVYLLGDPSDPTTIVTLSGNQYINNSGYFYQLNSACIRVSKMQGTVVIDGETFDRNTANAAGGTFIAVDGANTGTVVIGVCHFRGRAGSNMTRGIVCDSIDPPPSGSVVIKPGSTFGESVTTKWTFTRAVETPTYIGEPKRGTNLGDTSPTLTLAGGSKYVLPEATLTANRTVTLGTGGAVTGEALEIERRDTTAFTLAIVNGGGGGGTKYTFPVSVKRRARVKFDGVDWQLDHHEKIDG